ncbi:MAG TPA: hypothetical protein VGK82_03215 [Pyrinomonadaceae bacterium]
MKTKSRANVESDSDTSPAKQVAGFIAKFDPGVAKLTRAARSVVRKRFPTAIELVYDNYNALAIGYSSTERTSDVLFSLAVYARGVNLYFMYGRSLPDPHKLLQGSGNQGAFVRLDDVSVLDDPGVKELIQAAVKHAEPPLPTSGRGYTIVKSVSAKQRPRRI